MAMRWKHKGMRTAKSERFDGLDYCVLIGEPVDGTGYGYCPRCDATESNQTEIASVTQQYLGGAYGDVTSYWFCDCCTLKYVYQQMDVLL